MAARTVIRIVLLVLGMTASGASQAQTSPALVTHNGVPNQSVLYTKVNGFTPIVNGFPVIVGESYQPNLTGTSVNQTLYASGSNPYTFGIYNIFCTLGASVNAAGVVSLSVSYTDAVSGALFSYTMGSITLSTTAPTLIPPIHIAASNASTITTTSVLISGTATFTKDCYISSANHH